jgi:hypothetical protein
MCRTKELYVAGILVNEIDAAGAPRVVEVINVKPWVIVRASGTNLSEAKS